MYPGSGGADRHNGSYFAPIRAHLLARRCAICSFDKRGVGASSGRWQDADIVEQAQDVLAVVGTVVAAVPMRTPVGLFGHSQGGWVVLEVASRTESVGFVVTNSGPGVSPGEQMRYAALSEMTAAGASAAEVNDTMRHFDMALSLMRDDLPFGPALRRLEAAVGSTSALSAVARLVPADADEWRFASAIIDYEPRRDMSKVRVPLLAVFGTHDDIVPVRASVRAFRDSVRGDLLTLKLFAGADHRIHTGDGHSLADGYLQTLSAFVALARAPHETP